MNKLRLLLAGMAVSGALTTNAAEKVVFDFESGAPANGFNGQGWGVEGTLVDNPYKCGNTSSKCMKMDISGYGCDGYWCEEDLSKYVVAIDVFSYSDEVVKGYSGAVEIDTYQNVKAKQWTTLYYDWRSAGKTGAGMLYFGGTASGVGTLLVDNIRFVDEVGANYDCDAMPTKTDVDYSYGRLQIGGGGFVSGLLSIPGKIKLARTDVGGAYKWDPSKCEWKQMFDFVSEGNVGLLSVEAMAVDPNNTDNMYFLCGCMYYSSQLTAVVYTKDGGKTFKSTEVSNLPFFVHGNGDGRNAGERIAVDPKNSNIIYCGSRVGTPLIMSTDGGKSFKAVSTFPKVYNSSVAWPSWDATKYPSTANSCGVCAVAFDADKSAGDKTSRIYVGVSTAGDNVFVSEDGGSSWKSVAINSNLMPVRMKVVDGELLVTMADKCWGASSGKIYRYNPTTGTATDISATTSACSDIVVKPSDHNYMITSTNNTWVPQAWDNGSSANGDIIYVSKNGGKSWTSLQNKMVLTNNGVTWVPGYALHWCGSICIDPENENKASFTSGNGIWSCNNIWSILDDETCKPEIYFDVQGVEETVPFEVVSVPGGDAYSVIGDYTGFRHTSVSEYAAIHYPSPGTSHGIAYAGSNPKVLARVSASEYASQNSYYTTDGGATWNSMGNTSAYSVAVSSDGKTVVTANKTVKYGPLGGSLSAASGPSAANYVAADPVNANYFYAGEKDNIYVSSDGGKTFKSCFTKNGDFIRMCVVPGEEGLVYVPATDGAYVSKDFGATFTKLPGLTLCKAIGAGKGANGYILYAWGSNGSYTGVLRSEDKGATWQVIADDAHQFGGLGNGRFIVGDWNVAGRFYMGSTGLGIIYGDEAAQFEAPVYSCYAKTNCKVTESGNELVDSANGLVVSPNPTLSTFSVNESGDLVVMNALGVVVYEGAYVENTEVGANLPAGVYFVRINGGVLKLVKK